MPTYDGPTGCNVLRDMWLNVREGFTPAQGDKLIAAIVDYVFTGVEPVGLPKQCRTHMAALMPSLRKYRAAATNGMRNGRAGEISYRTDYDPEARSHRKTVEDSGEKAGQTPAGNAPESTSETNEKNATEKQSTTPPLAGETLATGRHRTQDRTQDRSGHRTPAWGCPQYVIRNTEQGQVTERDTSALALPVSGTAPDAGRAGEPAAAPLAPPRSMADAIGFNLQLGEQLRAIS